MKTTSMTNLSTNPHGSFRQKDRVFENFPKNGHFYLGKNGCPLFYWKATTCGSTRGATIKPYYPWHTTFTNQLLRRSKSI